jgi:glutaminyl-tRNA synthetase
MKTGKFGGRVHTRFPPEPNGYLHLGHAKSICLNFGLADEFGGKTNLRFDDTNPCKEETEYVDSIMENVRWLGFEWDGLFYASDYFGQLYEWALKMIREGKAFVCDLSAEEVRKTRGTLTEPGKESPYRNRSVEENLDLFQRMKAGEFPDGARTLRAKIDMASANLNMRDPVMYRILHADHHSTGSEWCIYPMYDYAHGQSDSIEGITHSICTLEFEDHRPLYDWYVEALGIYHPQQIEFDRLNVTYTLLSKRKLLTLVQDGHVRGWDDPRMPTLAGIRRRGYPPEALRSFCGAIGVSKTNGTIELGLLEHHVRENLNRTARRVMAVLRPLRVVIDNYPEGQVDQMEAVNNPEDASAGTRTVPFSRGAVHRAGRFPRSSAAEIFPALAGQGSAPALRLLHHLPERGEGRERRGGGDPLHLRSGHARRQCSRRPQGEIDHPLGVGGHAIDAEVRMYDNLFTKENPGETEEGQDFTANLESQVARDSARQSSSRRWRRPRWAIASSSSAWDISASTRIPRPASRFSIAPWG